jgi:hypothetical protein
MWVFGGVAAMLLLQILYTYLPLMNTLFQSAPISMESWSRILGAGVIAYLVVEFKKWLQVRMTKSCCG